jgi:hypothetical protein
LFFISIKDTMFHKHCFNMSGYNMNALTKPKLNQSSVINFPRPCTLCMSRCNVSLNYGLWVCSSCVSNIEKTNTELFVSEKKSLNINI